MKSEPRLNVTIHGAKTLAQFTEGILERGFGEISRAGRIHHDYNAVIYQVHGAPQSEVDDRAILEQFKRDIAKKDHVRRVILLHRPDEIEIRYPELRHALQTATKPIGLTFLGYMHVYDDFFKAPNVVLRVIPHGFFENLSEELQVSPVVIGSHTTWGEMRSTEHLIQLLGEVFRKRDKKDIVGYIGGKPKDQLQIKTLRKQWVDHNRDVSITLIDAHNKQDLGGKRAENVVLVDSENKIPDNLGLTYNIQLYYLNNRVRTGESSGSAHSSISIPVVIEMNGSEAIEDLRTVKIPYSSKDDIGSIDFRTGAEVIVRSIGDGSYIDMLKHNLEQSQKFTPSYVAGEYVKLFEELK